MIHELLLSLTESAFGSHPCRVVSVTYRQLRPFHGGNTGSNPVGDANNPKNLRESLVLNQGPLRFNELLDCRCWQRLNAEYAKQFGVETANWLPNAAQKS